MEPILQVRNLTAKLQLQGTAWPAVDKVSFDLFPGKTLALVGESGCGKTMTALSILSLSLSPPALPPEGEVIFEGRNLLFLSNKELSKVRGGQIGMIFQDPSSSLNPLFTIGNQLMETVALHLQLNEEEAYERSLKALEDVGIPDAKRRMEEYPHEFSGGMRQRVMIAMAILCEPKILIADEPTTALDVTIQAQVLELIKSLQKKRKMAVLLITHDLGVVAEMADDVSVMYATQIVEQGSVREIFDQPSHPYTKALFQAFSRKKDENGLLKAIPGSVPSLQHLPKGCRFHPRCPFVFTPCYKGAVPFFQVKGLPSHHSACWLEDWNG